MRYIISSLKTGFVVLVVAAIGTAGIALAQTTDDSGPTDDQATERSLDRGFGHRGFGHRGAGGFAGVVDELADATGLGVQDILDQLGDGATIAGLAAANGSSGDAVVAALLEDLSARLDAAVADERITADEAAERLAAVEERLTELVETPDPIGAELAERQARIEQRIVERAEQREALLSALGMTEDELRAARQDGQTLGEIAESQGVAIDDVVAVLVAPYAERLAEAVAAGDLTQEEADERLAEATERTTQRVEEGEGFGRGFRGRGHGHHRGGFGGPGFGPGGPGNGPGGLDSGFGPAAGVTVDA